MAMPEAMDCFRATRPGVDKTIGQCRLRPLPMTNDSSFQQESRSGPVSRVLSRAAISLGRRLLAASARPTRTSDGADSAVRDVPSPPCLVLLPVGFAVPVLSPGPRCALTAPFHPCLSQAAILDFRFSTLDFGFARRRCTSMRYSRAGCLPPKLSAALRVRHTNSKSKVQNPESHPGHRRSVLCGTLPVLADGGCYPPPCPGEPGLSSTAASKVACRRSGRSARSGSIIVPRFESDSRLFRAITGGERGT